MNVDTLEVQEEHKLSHYARAVDSKDGKIIVGTRAGTLLMKLIKT